MAFFAQNGLFGHFRPLFWTPREGVLHQPLAPGPRGTPKWGFAGVCRERPKKAVFGRFCPFSGKMGILGSRRGTPGETPGTGPGNRGAPARGVDVKPPLAGRSGTGPRALPGPGWPGAPPGPPGPSRGLRDPLRAPWDPLPGLPGRGFYINPSHRGPAVPAGGPEGPPGTPGSKAPQEGWGCPHP